MIKCLIIDDEQPAIDIIEDYVNDVPFLTCVGTTTNPVEGLSLVNQLGVDLVFVDIQMPYLTGIDFAKTVKGKCKIIFTTAFDQYAIEGFDLDVLDYLLKPVPFTRFLKAAQKAHDVFSQERSGKNNGPSGATKYLTLRGDTKGTYIKVDYADIEYIESAGNYITVVGKGAKAIARTTISAVADQLPQDQFVRVQKSFIVNLNEVHKVIGNTILLKSKDGKDKKEVLIGSTFKDHFLEIIKQNLAAE